MIKKTIENKINRLEEIYSKCNDSAVRLIDNIILTYAKKVINKLNEIIKHNSHAHEIFIEKLTLFLTDNWDLVKGSLLSYTALPEYEITDLVCDIAEYVAKEKNMPIIRLIMSTVNVDSLLPNQYPNLDSLDATQFRTLIKCHIISATHTFLIPVALFADDKIASIDDLKFHNVYYDHEVDDPSSAYLKNEELKLLANHSDATRAIWNAKNHYQVLLENKDTLLGQLNILINKLLYGSVLGVGKEEDAGNDSYLAILNFNEYWQNLSFEVHNQLPTELVSKINKILELASPNSEKEKNEARKHSNLIDTCLATNRADLQQAIQGHKAQLDEVSLTPQQKKSQIDEIKKLLQKTVQNLRDSLKKGDYAGQEQRGITTKILEDLKIELIFNSFGELTYVLKGRSAQEIREICKSQKISEEIVKITSNVENLVILTIGLSDEVLEALLCGIKQPI